MLAATAPAVPPVGLQKAVHLAGAACDPALLVDSKAKFELRRLDAGEIPVALHTRLPLAMLYEYHCLSSLWRCCMSIVVFLRPPFFPHHFTIVNSILWSFQVQSCSM